MNRTHDCPNRKEDEYLIHRGYQKTKFLVKTLQGDVCNANDVRSGNNNMKRIVLKRTDKTLHNKGVCVADGTEYAVHENIIREAGILETLHNSKSRPSSLIGFVDFFQTPTNLYLAMEDGGTSFFNFVQESHKSIVNGLISIKHWRKQCKHMFSQMIQFQHFMIKKGFCNLDISLENILISHDCYYDTNTKQLKNCFIKFIDFGVTQHFPDKNNFKCSKFVGKKSYQSPKVYANSGTFDARQADIWSLGVVLFAMVTGGFPYHKPRKSDPYFKLIKKQQWMALLQITERVHYFSEQSLDLLKGLLNVKASKRLTVHQIRSHPWIARYFFKTHPTQSSRSISLQSPTSPMIEQSVSPDAAAALVIVR